MCKKLVLLTSVALVLALVGADAAFGIVWEGRISSATDDYEEYVSDGDMDNGSGDLEITEEGSPASNQFIGLRFNGVDVPQGASIANAYVQFHVDEVDVPDDNRPGTKFLRGEAVDNAAPFLDVAYNMSSRPTTSAEASWDWPEWLTTHEEGPDQRTSDISAVIQEITDRPGWSAGNSLVLIITGSGENTAEAFEGESASAALLHIEFTSKYASNPNPPDGTFVEDTWVSLTWDAGDTAVSHDVYLSDNLDDVTDGTGDAFRGNQAFNFFTAGFPGFAYPDGLVPGTTYYWRIDEVEADGTTKYEGSVWSFTVPSKTAYNPNPADGAKYVATDATLSWTPGFGAKAHYIYFGDDLDTVADATGAVPQGTATYAPGTLEQDKVYYWRVDEFDGIATHRSDIWSFTTLPVITITDPDLIGWWKFDEGVGDTALDFSGHGNDGTLGGDPEWVEGIIGGALDLDGDDYVSMDGVADDLTSRNFTLSAWIKTTQASEGNVFASNTGGSHVLLFGVDNGNIYVDDGPSTDYPPTVNDNQWHMITFVKDGSNGYIYTDGVQVGKISTSIDVTTETRWSIGQEWDSGPSDFYMGMVDEARIYNKPLTADEVLELTRGDPLLAWNPNPSNGAIVDVERAKQPLSWTPGDDAAQHDVYFGLDITAVENADSSDATGIYRGRQAAASYTPGETLDWGTGPYYWRIDELNTNGTLSTGGIWSFTVADHLIVDDFEGYTDDDLAGEAIWQSWIDGFGVADNGAQVGYLLPPYAEQTIVHGGGQSIPLMYDNTAGVRNSEAELALTALRDWTAYGVSNLSIWFRGYPGSVGSFVEGPVGTYTMTASGTDISGNADEFHYAYKSLSGAGSITARVVSVQNTNAWAKAAVMIRETLDPGSRHAMACLTPGNGVAAEARVDTDNASTSNSQTGLTAPYWIKLERDVAGNFTVTHSANGTSWSPVQGAIPNRVLMSANVYIGLAVTSHNAGVTCEAVFSNVTTTGNVSGQWAHQDIGVSSNAAEPLYVALSNAAGTPAIVAHDDPAAATIDTWTEWIIPLQAFADQGINLTNVDKIAIGLGNKGNAAAAGGSGTMFFDDIGLYRP